MEKNKINIDFLEKTYFTYDKSVPVETDYGNVDIIPVKLRDYIIFIESADILCIDKNSLPSVEIIQMSYLEFLVKIILQENLNKDKFINILKLCLNFKNPYIYFNENNKPVIFDRDKNIEINEKQFEKIRRVIMYQNILHYNDKYINPELKKAMVEVDELRNKNLNTPNLERKIAIITAHCGILKKDQLEMTCRSHSLLFEEVCGEIEFLTVRPIALYSGNEIDHWIFKKNRNKFNDYITKIDDYAKSMGTDSSNITVVDNIQINNNYQQLYENFK